MKDTMRKIRIGCIHPDPDQPRKEFDEGALRELASSIEANGLIQPILVRPIEGREGHYTIIAGERRYRAHGLLQAKTVPAIINHTSNEVQAAQQAIIENLQRVDISPLEEARAYQRMLDVHGHTVETLAKAIGIKQPHRISNRICLLDLSEDHQQLLDSGNLTPSQAFELAQLQGDNERGTLMRLIMRGDCASYESLRNARLAITEVESQTNIFDEEDLPPAPTATEVRAAATFERRVETVAQMLRNGIADNEISAIKKVAPGRAALVADQMVAMVTDLKRLEKALRQVAVQQELLTA